MRPRKPGETDEHYIARLEQSREELQKGNNRLRQDHARLYDTIMACASHTSLVLQAAAEICGVKDDPDVRSCVVSLEKLATLVWHDDRVDAPKMPKLCRPEQTYGGDVEMLVCSALEKIKAFRVPWEKHPDGTYAQVPPLPDSATLQDMWFEVHDALNDLQMSRDCLRMDLRSGMYDYCFGRIYQALNRTQAPTEQLCPE